VETRLHRRCARLQTLLTSSIGPEHGSIRVIASIHLFVTGEQTMSIVRLTASAALGLTLTAASITGCSDDDGSTPPQRDPNHDVAGHGGAAGSADEDVASMAADLRVNLNLLLSEHMDLAAKATGAALGGRGDEFKAYGALLNDNGNDIGDLVGAAFGNAAKT